MNRSIDWGGPGDDYERFVGEEQVQQTPPHLGDIQSSADVNRLLAKMVGMTGLAHITILGEPYTACCFRYPGYEPVVNVLPGYKTDPTGEWRLIESILPHIKQRQNSTLFLAENLARIGAGSGPPPTARFKSRTPEAPKSNGSKLATFLKTSVLKTLTGSAYTGRLELTTTSGPTIDYEDFLEALDQYFADMGKRLDKPYQRGNLGILAFYRNVPWTDIYDLFSEFMTVPYARDHHDKVTVELYVGMSIPPRGMPMFDSFNIKAIFT